MIGPLFHSRWLALATEVLRFSVSLDVQLDKHNKVKLLATYIVGMYWKAHIQVKYKSSVVDEQKIFFEEILAQKLLFAETDQLSIMQLSLQQNFVKRNYFRTISLLELKQ